VQQLQQYRSDNACLACKTASHVPEISPPNQANLKESHRSLKQLSAYVTLAAIAANVTKLNAMPSTNSYYHVGNPRGYHGA